MSYGHSPWTAKLASNKHIELVNSTIKSAANTMANRITGFKNTLASSATNSPSKVSKENSYSTGVSGPALLLSQFASLVAEKIPANFGYDDDDCQSLRSLDFKRHSIADSADDLRSREGSIAQNLVDVTFALCTDVRSMERNKLEQHWKDLISCLNPDPEISYFWLFLMDPFLLLVWFGASGDHQNYLLYVNLPSQSKQVDACSLTKLKMTISREILAWFISLNTHRSSLARWMVSTKITCQDQLSNLLPHLLVPLMIIIRQIGFILLLAGGALFLSASLIAAFFMGVPLSRSFGNFGEFTQRFNFTGYGLK
uniref:Uncharacterized protein n=1 Tax=Tetranychus urticae TaxID=32264 RepID=T1KBT8_TETUR